MKYLVTGGNGFMGSHFIRSLAERAESYQIPTEVVNVDARIYGDIPSCIDDLYNSKYFSLENQVNLSSYVSIGYLCPDYVVSFAAQSHIDRSIEKPRETFAYNVDDFSRLLNIITFYVPPEKKPKKFIHISTDEVYGPQEYGAVTEYSPYRPRTPYAASKAASDHIALSYYHTYKLPVIVVHASNNYGTWQYPEKFIPKMLWNVVNGKPITIHGEGDHTRDWIMVDDFTRYLHRVIDEGIAGQVYNISGCHERSTVQIAEMIKKHMEFNDYKPEIEFIPDRPNNDKRYCMRSNHRIGIDAQMECKSPEYWLPRVMDWYLSDRGMVFMKTFWENQK